MSCCSVPAAAARARNLPIEQLAQTALAWLPTARPPAPARRPFNRWNTFWLFLGQVLRPDAPCRQPVCEAQAWLADPEGPALSSSSSAYCQARARLPLRTLCKAQRDLTRSLIGPAPQPIWRERVVRVLDGSSLSMPDEPANQERYPQPKGQKPGCGFPTMRVAVIFCLATGAIMAMAHGALRVAERTLARRLWHCLEKGCVLLADRGFCGFADYYMLARRGVDAVMRLHQRRSAGTRQIKRLGKGDWLMEWIRTGPTPKWLTPQQWRAMPSTLIVRHVDVRVEKPGFRVQSFTIATTLLDPKAYPAEAFAELYGRRWHVELFLRDIKITMRMDRLRCKSPALIHRELVMHIIAYNLVRALMLQAATQHRADPMRLSLAGTVTAIGVWAPRLATLPTKPLRRKHLMLLLAHIAHDPIPLRPDRVEPRALKRRLKNYQLLNKPRALFKEILHRNKYQKALS